MLAAASSLISSYLGIAGVLGYLQRGMSLAPILNRFQIGEYRQWLEADKMKDFIMLDCCTKMPTISHPSKYNSWIFLINFRLDNVSAFQTEMIPCRLSGRLQRCYRPDKDFQHVATFK